MNCPRLARLPEGAARVAREAPAVLEAAARVELGRELVGLVVRMAVPARRGRVPDVAAPVGRADRVADVRAVPGAREVREDLAP